MSRIVRWEELWAKAREHFGITRLRPGQRELIEAVLTGHDALGVLATGAGKSLFRRRAWIPLSLSSSNARTSTRFAKARETWCS